MLFTGWTFRGFDAVGEAPAAPVFLFSTNATGVVALDPQRVLGMTAVAGTSTPRIMDLNRDGRNDLFYLGHNESPALPTRSERFLQNADGTFARLAIAGPKLEGHNSNVGDFNGDRFIDALSSSYRTEDNFFASQINPATVDGMPPGGRWGFPTLYLNDQAGGFSAFPFLTRNAQNRPILLGSGSACAMGDLNGDGKPEIVIVDAFQNLNGWTRNENFLLSNVEVSGGIGRGDLRTLPPPYFDRDGSYAAFNSQYKNKTHNIHAEIVDVNNGGRPDLVVSAMLWSAQAGTQAGVYQVLLNQRNLQFTDVTDTTLHNFFLGVSGSHQPIY